MSIRAAKKAEIRLGGMRVVVTQIDEDARPGDWNVFVGDELVAWHQERVDAESMARNIRELLEALCE